MFFSCLFWNVLLKFFFVDSVVGLCSDGDGSIVVEKWRGIE